MGEKKREERKEVGEAWQKDDYSPSAELIYLLAASVESFTDKSEPEFLVLCYRLRTVCFPGNLQIRIVEVTSFMDYCIPSLSG